jgi:hypothetical protein
MSEPVSMDRTRVVKSTLRSQGSDALLVDLTEAECMHLVWQLTLDAWMFKDPTLAESRFQRHAVRVVRGKG